MASNVAIRIIADYLGKSAFNRAKKDVTGLDKTVAMLGRRMSSVFAVGAVTAFGKASLNAFVQDDKAARALSKTLSNLGLAYADPGLKKYISDLEMQSAVVDDELRPALDRLLRATGSVTKSQELLGLALDISAGTGKSLAQVSQSLQKAYLGQTQALGRLGVGLSKAELSSGNFEAISQRLSELFAGQATVAADSYAGSMQRLAIASNNAKEIIGKGLVDALAGAGGDQGLNGALNAIIKSATIVGDLLTGIGRTVGAISAGVRASFGEAGFIAGFRSQTASYRAQDAKARAQYGGAAAEVYKAQAAAAAEKKAAAARKAQLTATKALTKAQSDQLKLKKAGTIFDLEKIQVTAALQGKISDEERLRLELQKALLDGNASVASKLASELTTVQNQTIALKEALASITPTANPFQNWTVPNVAGLGSTAYAEMMSYTGGATTATPKVEVSLNVTAPAGIQVESLNNYTADGGSLTISRNNPSWSLGTN